MTIKQKFLGLTLTLIVIVAIGIGASGVLAQDSGNATPTPYPTGTPGYTWNMYGMMWGNRQGDPIWTAVAGALGIDVNTLFTELQSGSTLAQIAEAHGVDVQTVYDAALNIMTDHMNAMVEAGYMTQAQANERLGWMRDNVAQMPIWAGDDCDPCFMGRMMGGAMHGGMMNGCGSTGMHGMMDGGMHDGMMGGHHG